MAKSTLEITHDGEPLRIGERFTMHYNPLADPTGYFEFVERSIFEIVGVTPTGYEVKKVLDI